MRIRAASAFRACGNARKGRLNFLYCALDCGAQSLLSHSFRLSKGNRGFVMAGQKLDGSKAPKSTWRKVLDFPLVAMLTAVALFIAAFAAANLAAQVLPPKATLAGLSLRAAVDIALVLLVYKLVIARLGEMPRDDLLTMQPGASWLG